MGMEFYVNLSYVVIVLMRIHDQTTSFEFKYR